MTAFVIAEDGTTEAGAVERICHAKVNTAAASMARSADKAMT
jgi:hypothetical protein